NQIIGVGVQLIATSGGVEATKLRDREDILVAGTPENFARALIELYESEDLWNRLSKNGARKTRALYSVKAARKKLEFLFSDDHFKSFAPPAAARRPELTIAGQS